MDDLIRRQAAIDALWKALHEFEPWAERCLTCKHAYHRQDDDEVLHCRCRKECRYEAFKTTEEKGNG